ncbi:MAG: HAD-IA family hydrolase [Chloroflexota bacterium]
MATKAVFFDWYNTLACYDPPNETLHLAVCHSYGIDLDPQLVRAGIAEADRYFYEENSHSRVDKRPPSEQVELFTHYEDIVLKKAGAAVPKGMALPIWMKVRDMARGSTFVLFDDVLPTLKLLRGRSVLTGLVSNLPQDMTPLLTSLGLLTALDYVVSPKEAGVEKPDPGIFRHALTLAKVEPAEAIHVGDQYFVDVVGARGAGIRPLLLDRHDISPDADCPRIRTLGEVVAYL